MKKYAHNAIINSPVRNTSHDAAMINIVANSILARLNEIKHVIEYSKREDGR